MKENNGRSQQQQRRVARHAGKVDTNHFFDLLTSPQLLETIEALLPAYRERKYPPAARPSWMTAEVYAGYPDALTLRETKVGKAVLVTSFLKAREVCQQELSKLFLQRWNVEVDLRHIKSTLGMETLSCKTPSMCEKEMWVYMLAYDLIRLAMAQAAEHAGVLPRHLSFTHTLQVWACWNQRQFLSNAPEDTAALFRLIAQIRVGNRPGRVEQQEEDAMQQRFGHSITYRIATGPHRGRKVFTLQTLPPHPGQCDSGQSAKVAGFSLHAGVVAEPHRRQRGRQPGRRYRPQGPGRKRAARFEQACVKTTRTRYNGAIHGFATFPVPMRDQVLQQIADWLRSHYG